MLFFSFIISIIEQNDNDIVKITYFDFKLQSNKLQPKFYYSPILFLIKLLKCWIKT